MFREMRRKKQMLSEEECIEILERGNSGVLAAAGDEEYPYTVPLSYVYADSKIYFHCAKTGHKLDAIMRNPKVSFCVVDYAENKPEEYTMYYRSVVLFGKARILEGQEKRNSIEMLSAKYSPGLEQGYLKEIDKLYDVVCMVEVTVDHMSGKAAKELMRK